MFTIDKNMINEIVIRNSRFICILYKVNNNEDIKQYLFNIRNIYKDASHYCWAYINNEYKKSSDDGEPGGTAGIPMLQVLEKNNLNNVLAIVIRYFGGIKLGAGGLVRAYTKSVVECVKMSNIKELVKGYNTSIEFSYDKLKQVDYILKDYNIISKCFGNTISYVVNLSEDIITKLKLIDGLIVKINESVYIEK